MHLSNEILKSKADKNMSIRAFFAITDRLIIVFKIKFSIIFNEITRFVEYCYYYWYGTINAIAFRAGAIPNETQQITLMYCLAGRIQLCLYLGLR